MGIILFPGILFLEQGLPFNFKNSFMKKLSIIAFVLSVASMSCKKDLNVQPISVITSASFYKTENDANGALNGMYVYLRNEAANNLFLLGEARSEVLTSALVGTLGYDRYYLQSLSSSTPGPNWRGLYSTINAANLLLKYVPNISFTSDANKNNILAQAYSMRAFIYYVLVRTWGDVPVRTEPTEQYDPSTIQIAKSSKDEVFKLIKGDLEKAITLFPDNKFSTGRNKWSKSGAQALKADIYLWTGKLLNGGATDFNIALSAITDLQTSDVQLLPKYSDIFDYNNKGNKEIIMAVRFQLLESSDNIYQNFQYNASNFPSKVTQGTKDSIGPVGSGSNSVMQITPLVRNQFSNDDQRKYGTFYEVFTTVPAFYSSITTKFNGTVSNGQRFYVSDYILYRYADVLLMKAEAKNALGQDPSSEVNLVRKRAYGANYNSHIFTNGTKAQNDDAILKERLLELTTEGKRWWDLIRFGKAFDLVPLLQPRIGQNYLLLFPIGSDVLSLEPKVTQNTGW